jgi:Transcription factor DP/E2F/DP family winged-helix DNA-binding domain
MSEDHENRKRPPPVETAAAEIDAMEDNSNDTLGNTTPPSKPAAAKRQAVESASSRDTGGSKPYKGLRHFSMMVCKKVEEKGTTSYNEVADELVLHVIEERRKEEPDGKFDEKNIRRRVYDALNVLMAMDIIAKDKKAIAWKGLPTSAHQDIEMLEREREFRQKEVVRKRQSLQDLVTQQVCFRNLVAHNLERAMELADPNDNNIPLPFIVVNTHSSAVIQCNMSRDLTDVMFDFSAPFEINDDNTILKRLGL